MKELMFSSETKNCIFWMWWWNFWWNSE